MPIRIPAARKSEAAVFGIAGVGAFAPFYLMAPGAEERITRQTAKWAPRWERQTAIWAPRWERNISHFAPPAQKAAQHVDSRLPLEKMAKNVDRRIKYGIDRFGKK